MPIEQLRGLYIASLMNYIEMEYENVPDVVSPEMEQYFYDCFDQEPPTCYPNAAGVFYETFLRPLSH